MDPIQEAIEEIESRDLEDDFSYQAIAKKFGIDRRALARRHQGLSTTRNAAHLVLHPEHEAELIQYIRTLNKQSLPSSRAIIQQFASQLAGKPVSRS